jgi:hypothetical protein
MLLARELAFREIFIEGVLTEFSGSRTFGFFPGIPRGCIPNSNEVRRRLAEGEFHAHDYVREYAG